VLRIVRTDVKIDDLLKEIPPDQLKTFHFYSKSERETKEIRKRLEALGYPQFNPFSVRYNTH